MKTLAALLKDKKMRKAAISGFTQSSIAMNFAATGCKVPLLFIMRDADEAGYLYQDLKTLCVAGKVQQSPFKGDLEGLPFFFPSSYKRAVKFGQKDAAGEVMRAETLIALADNSQLSTLNSQLKIVTYPAALSELVASRQTIDNRMLTLRRGETTELDVLVTKLRELGFVEVDYVYEPGQFAVRGSIVDIYSFSSEQPYRIDFFDDEIDTLRSFDVESQLSKEMLDSVTIVPEISKSANDKIPFLDLLPDDTVIVTNDTQYVIDAIDYIYKEGFSKQALSDRLTGVTEADKAEIMRELTASLNLCKASTFAKAMERFRVIENGNVNGNLQPPSSNLKSQTSPQPLFHKNFELLAQTLSDYQTKGYQTFICSDSDKQIERLKEIFNNEELRIHSSLNFIKGTLHEGYIDDELKRVLFTDHRILERFHKYQLKGQQAKRGKMALTMKELQEMEPGDFIVHVDFGIGKFAGLVRIPTMTKQPDGTMVQGYQEVIRIIYQKNDKVDVSIHSLYKISKYRRADSGEPPKLSTLGTGAWERIKERAKTRIKDIARDLIKLYAKRRHEKGFAFSADTYMQAALEGSFLYEDTPDQMKATQEVKHDMEQARPMDRLVCGDVGFGKTEVAIRAAFKAAADGKQVAVLVPTTVLAFQHYQTFSKRLQGLPVRVDYLSRARTPKQVKQITEDLEAGRIDILVGTHRMLTKTVKWHDIGLLIIDEEQKFGVSTKEKLRQLKTNIDTLTMSATPIPRTLQF